MNYALPVLLKYLKNRYQNSNDDEAPLNMQIASKRKITSLYDSWDGYGDFKTDDLYEFVDKAGRAIVLKLKKKSDKKVNDNVNIPDNQGVLIDSNTINTNEDLYKELNKAFGNLYDDKLGKNVLGIYDLKIVYGKLENRKLVIYIYVGKENNGKQVYVIHKKHDNSYEKFSGIVKDGILKIEVTELSPFAIALSNEVVESTNDDETKDDDGKSKDKSPQTSSEDISIYVITMVISLISIIGLISMKGKDWE